MARRTAWAALAALAVLTAGCSSGGTEASSRSTPQAESGSPSRQTDPGSVHRYVAMGDSYTAAPGVPTQDPSDPCLRSTRSYPELVHDQIRPEEFADVSCSGATTSDITGSQATGSGDLAPQLDAVTDQTDLVTIGIGGNDFDLFTTMVGRCSLLRGQDPTGSPCERNLTKRNGDNRLLDRLPTIGERIAAVVEAVQKRAPEAEVQLVGYPQIVPASGTCPSLLPLATGDYTFAREINEGLNRVVSEVASLTGATFVDIWTASAGHDICATQPWINGRADNDRAAPFHPFAVEQQTVARLVEQTLVASRTS